MKREIKFRVFAYTDEGNKMVYLGPLECDNGLWFSSLNDHLDDYIDKIMQYTGVKDINGIEIYEGDVLRCIKYGIDEDLKEDKNEIWACDTKPVVWDNDLGGWFINGDTPFSNQQPISWYDVIEVVGNIYENSSNEQAVQVSDTTMPNR